MKSLFWLKITAFLLPIILLLAFPVFVLWQTEELWSVPHVINYQEAVPRTLYAPAYNSFEKNYKMESLLKTQPQVLALGNSRILNIRSEFFNPGVSFYNGALLVKKIQHYRTVLDRIPTDKQPKVLLMVVDQAEFNENVNSFNGYDIDGELQEQAPGHYFLNAVVRNWLTIYKDFFSHKFTFEQIINSALKTQRIGTLAMVGNEGFRTDGSYRNGREIFDFLHSKIPDYNSAATVGLLNAGVGTFRPGAEVSPRALLELDNFLQECQRRGIYVIGYLPPYPSPVYDQLKKTNSLQYVFNVFSKTQPLFSKYGFQEFNFDSVASFGGQDQEFIDGLHAGEKATLKYFIKMVEANKALQAFTNLAKLKEDLQKSPDNLEVFGN